MRVDSELPLREYQWQGVEFLVSHEAALLADEMGLGKTVQAAVALRALMRERWCRRALVVAPSSLQLNWLNEMQRWAPQLTTRRVQGDANDRRAHFELPIPVLVASYEQVRSYVLRPGDKPQFDVVILDEAQRIKNINSDSALACRLLRRARAWALTGTPLENRLDDLMSILSFLRPGSARPWMTRVELQACMRDIFLRRRKTDVLPELPPIIIQDVRLELEGAQLEAYWEVWESRRDLITAHGASEVNLLAVLTRLKQLCNFDPASDESAKLEALRTVLDGLLFSGGKVLIVSQYVETLRWLSGRLDEFPHALYHGSMSETEREESLRDFREGPGPRALLLSLRAGGVGLNLQEASVVVLFDRWWNPAVEAQAMARAHRFGRLEPLHVVRFLVADTVEERVALVLAEKQQLFDEAIEQAAQAEPSRLGRRELLRALQLGEFASDKDA